MARKVVRVYLTPSQKRILERICEKLEMPESDVLRLAFMDYAKQISMITETVH